jgi:hypothetical protein
MEDASLHMQSINLLKTQAVKRKGWNGRYFLTKRIRGDLIWLLDKIIQNKPRCFRRLTPTFSITTDASETGWGAMLTNLKQ